VKAPANKRGSTSNKYALVLRDHHAGWLTDVAGALAVGDIGGEGNGRYEELALRCWPGMPREFYAWVAESFAAQPATRDGDVVLADDGDSEVSRLSFQGGVVTELLLPPYEPALRDSVKIGLKFSPRASKRSYSGGHLDGETLDLRRPAPPTDVELQIDGLEEACSQVRRIEGLTIRQAIERARREAGTAVRRTGAPSVTPLTIVLAEAKAQGFVRWHEACQSGRSDGRAATLTLGLQAVGFTIVLRQVRPVSVVEEPNDGGEGRRREVRIELTARGAEFMFAPTRPDVV
jgi:hypothetical protein